MIRRRSRGPPLPQVLPRISEWHLYSFFGRKRLQVFCFKFSFSAARADA